MTSGDENLLLGNWAGASTLNNIIALSARFSTLLIDWNYIKADTLSLQRTTTAQALHIYNTLGAVSTAPTNYERGCVDWTLTSNVFRIAAQAGGTGVVRLIAIDGFQKAGAPAAGDLPSGTFALINDTSGNATWLAYNAAGTIRKVQLT